MCICRCMCIHTYSDSTEEVTPDKLLNGKIIALNRLWWGGGEGVGPHYSMKNLTVFCLLYDMSALPSSARLLLILLHTIICGFGEQNNSICIFLWNLLRILGQNTKTNLQIKSGNPPLTKGKINNNIFQIYLSVQPFFSGKKIGISDIKKINWRAHK